MRMLPVIAPAAFVRIAPTPALINMRTSLEDHLRDSRSAPFAPLRLPLLPRARELVQVAASDSADRLQPRAARVNHPDPDRAPRRPGARRAPWGGRHSGSCRTRGT